MTKQVISRIFIFISAMLFVVALFVRIISPSWDVAGLFFLIASLIVFVIAVFFDWRNFINFFTYKTTRTGLSSGLIILIAVGVCGAINYLVYRYPVKWDLSEFKDFTLSGVSKEVARSFKDKVQVTYLYIPDMSARDAEDKITMSIKKYQDENPKIKFKKINLLKQPQMTQEYQLNDQEQALFIEYKDRRERFYNADENSITQAMVRLLKGKKVLYFSVGNKEQTIENTTGKGLSSLKSELERLFYDVREMDLNNETLPKIIDALVIIGPDKPLDDELWKKVMDYYKSGGRIFIAFDPLADTDTKNHLKDFGLEYLDGTLHMEESALSSAGTHMIPGIAAKSEHPIVRDMSKKSVTLFYVTGAFKILDQDIQAEITPLVITPEFVSLRKGFTINDKKLGEGSYPLVVHVKSKGRAGGEVIVAADSDLFANQFLYQHLNANLMFNVFNYLSKDEDLIKPRAKTNDAQDFLVTDTSYRIYLASFILPFPLFFFSIGGFLWFRRKWL